ncbi:hypothetical protein CH338_15755 [Rhodoplanes elegans]|uniref:HEPN AbiU2-like domain-containing protein n=2 Tax=Rhodoplanes elegans TaxID=29408 RepID=A0A327KJM5_9BRAD|nr:hypothetical protein CH338_15755 [Rhodoplanes elegans]
MAVEEAISWLERAFPRLNSLAFRTAVSFGLWAGANQFMKEKMGDDRAEWDIVAGYRSDVVLMAVIRIYALLDSDFSKVSYQGVNRLLKRDEVVEALVKKSIARPDVLFPERTEAEARSAIVGFRAEYAKIDWKVHGRLVHFRNLGVAHLTYEEFSTRLTYNELETLVGAIVRIAERLSVFLGPDVPAAKREDVENYAETAADVWRTAKRQFDADDEIP